MNYYQERLKEVEEELAIYHQMQGGMAYHYTKGSTEVKRIIKSLLEDAGEWESIAKQFNLEKNED